MLLAHELVIGILCSTSKSNNFALGNTPSTYLIEQI